jgi:hypothetical protein
MPDNPLPSLDSGGWVTGVAQKAEKLFSYFLASERSQSNHYPDIQSLPYIIQQNSDDDISLQTEIRNALSKLFEDYFEYVEIEVLVRPQDGQENNPKQDIRISALVRSNGVQYSLQQLLQSSNKTISNIVNLNRNQ